jgi:pentatricopeptide repeat protein
MTFTTAISQVSARAALKVPGPGSAASRAHIAARTKLHQLELQLCLPTLLAPLPALPALQCGSQQQLRRALELVAEMRSRGIQCNVHTYSALMNVCIKGNELDLALDVYRQMLAEGCTPNLVTCEPLPGRRRPPSAIPPWRCASARMDGTAWRCADGKYPPPP